MDSVKTGLVRQLTKLEASHETWNRHGVTLVGYELRLASVSPLDIVIICEALELLHKKIPSLGLCIKEEEGNMFYYRQDPTKIDFEVCTSKDLAEASLETISKPYESEVGPIWRAKLVLPPTIEKSSAFPYKYDMTLGFHHSMSDGTSNLMTCNHFLSILNDLIAGQPVSKDSVGELYDCQWAVEAEKIAKKNLETDSELRESYRKKAHFIGSRCSPWSKLDMTEEPKENFTRMYRKVLDMEPTQSFIRKCKHENVTLNSGFVAVLDSCLYKFLQKRGIADKCNEMLSMHAISYRRYDQNHAKDFGLQIGVVNSECDLSLLQQSDVWGHARRFGNDLKKSLDQKQSFYDIAMFNLSDDKDKPGVSIFDKDVATYDYTVSNMGDTSKIFVDDGKHVVVDQLFRVGNIHMFANCFTILLHTFKGRLHLAFLFSARYVSDEISRELIEECMKELSKEW